MSSNYCLVLLSICFVLISATLLGAEVLAMVFEAPWREKDVTIRHYWVPIKVLQVLSVLISFGTALSLLFVAVHGGFCGSQRRALRSYNVRTQLATLTFFAFGFLAVGSQILLFEHFRRISLFLYANAANFALLSLVCTCQRMEISDEIRQADARNHNKRPASPDADEDALDRWICALEAAQRQSFSAPVGKVLREMRHMSLVESQLDSFGQI